MAKCPNGPSVKFLVNAVHTMEEFKLTGNHLKGLRPILTFSSNFYRQPHWKLLKEMFIQMAICGFVITRFVTTHTIVNFLHCECCSLEDMTLYGPSLAIAKSALGASFCPRSRLLGLTRIRSLEKKQKAGKYTKKVKAKTREMHQLSNPLEVDEFADM
ncbi:hypothetical protein HAX54_007068 [Datura stramonium]|uniref:Brix domain-containing protein n=1 Tax=Datura stramonium TaxID=4076 RepID=A0ABS8TCY3_DATST|nr:hypothetical protein [Datura stramonium]